MTWIEQITKGIKATFNAVRPALPFLPSILLICELKNRPGLSAIALASAIIQRLPEAGINTGVNVDGSPNKICGVVRIACEELVNEFHTNACVTSVIEPGTVIMQGKGANAGGPVTVFGSNIIPTQGLGLIR